MADLVQPYMLQVFKDRFERSAFFYEFRARYNERYEWEFGRPWIRCSDEQRRLLNRLIPSQYPAKQALHSDQGQRQWVRFDNTEFNILLNDQTLQDQFQQELEKKRTELGIAAPLPGLGVRRRPMSWSPIEAMDINKYHIRLLTDSERSALSKATKAYEKECQKIGLQP